MDKIAKILAAVVTAVALTAPVHADPQPLQCKLVGGFNTQMCRYPDGHVTQCDALTGCHPVPVAVNPDFWN